MDHCPHCEKNEEHKVCIICRKPIHYTEGWHDDGFGARHLKCEHKEGVR